MSHKSHRLPWSLAWLFSSVFPGFLLPVAAQDWGQVPVIRHADYQAVNTDGTSAYGGGFPIRLIGVVANDTEDWLDPTPDYNTIPWDLGGEAEFFVQAVNLDGTVWDPDPVSPFDDFGGTACWMGQNYGNLGFIGDPVFSHSDAEWTAELGRLGLVGGDKVTPASAVRAGDLVEIRVRAGLNFQGKMNVNEQHDKDPSKDFEMVVLQRGFGVAAAPLLLSDLKDAEDGFIFDPTRQTGGERWQGSLVRLLNVQVETPAAWAADTQIPVTDGVRTLDVRLGRDPGFDGSVRFQPGKTFDVAGVLNQSAGNGQGGYYLLALDIEEAAPVPPGLSLALMAGKTVVRWPHQAGGAALQYSATMRPGSWQPVAPEQVAAGWVWTYREPFVAGSKFFSLD